MSVTRYSRAIDLQDLENVHTLAVLAVPPGSRVLDLGAADGAVACALRDRGCQVTAIERDAEGVAALIARGLTTIQADLDTLPADAVPPAAFDVVLMLDVLEHLVDPGALLARTRAWLAPGGRALLSVPNVTHGAVRLSLLQGRFPRTDVGLLDRTHLHFFDQDSLQALVTGAGFGVLDLLTVERGLEETELEPPAAGVPAGVLEAVADDPLSRVYQFVVIAAPSAGPAVGGGLLQVLLSRLRSQQAAYRRLEDFAAQAEATGRAREDALTAELRRVAEYVAHLEATLRDHETRAASTHAAHEAALLAADAAHDAAAAAIDAAHEAASAATARQIDLEADRDMLRHQLTARVEELQQASDAIATLLRDLCVQREFAESLAAQVPRIAARGGEVRVLDELDRYQAVAPTPDAAATLAAEAAEFRRLQGAVAFRALARGDAWLRTMPWIRAQLSRLARRLAGASRR
ncbi:class I SAM-dependent methyltransferase [Luteitalea sp.]|uniref:class I SAM-dependent methyltransferase n=1 Tax=Luteitalea sp. TaxID=2004800 RepID=UPI0025B98432|nr:class I SAM-dependent methyltransferase [Luteitalea sp.]